MAWRELRRRRRQLLCTADTHWSRRILTSSSYPLSGVRRYRFDGNTAAPRLVGTWSATEGVLLDSEESEPSYSGKSQDVTDYSDVMPDANARGYTDVPGYNNPLVELETFVMPLNVRRDWDGDDSWVVVQRYVPSTHTILGGV